MSQFALAFDGTLTSVAPAEPAGSQPVAITVDSTLYVVNAGSNTASIFRINSLTGALTAQAPASTGPSPSGIITTPGGAQRSPRMDYHDSARASLAMTTFRSVDAELSYTTTGTGPDVVLLHPFPLNRHFWDRVLDQLSSRYRVVMPDLRGHGDSEVGAGPVTMEKLAGDLDRLCRELEIARAIFVGVSIGGYALFEFWRSHRERVAALVLANTRAGAEAPEGRASRLQIADKALREGTAGFVEDLIPKLLSKATLANRPDILDAARIMAKRMSPTGIAEVQRGMAARQDSVPTLATINVPTLVIAGADDSVPLSEMEMIHQCIAGSQFCVITKAGHYAAMEQPSGFGRVIRIFFDTLARA